ncbi:Putative transport protein [Klebsiella pneumoniae ISC21]|nr:Putative transport protein [Klebsiella pneumoniae ISC21]
MEGLSFWYYLSTYVVFEIIYTSIMVPYETLATEMTDDFSLRSKLTGYKAIFGKLANFLAAFIPGQFILLYGKDSATPFFLTGLTYGAILIVAISCLWLCSWERERGEEVETSAKKGLLSTLLSLAKDMRSTFLSTRIPQTSWYVPVRLWRGMAVCLHLHLFRDLRSTTRSSDGGRAEQPELDSAADLYGAVYRPVREKGLQQTLYPGAGDRHFRGSAVYLAVVFPSTVRPGDSADVRHYRAVRPGYRRGLLYTLDRLHLPGRCR